MCGRYAMFGPVSVSREAQRELELMELDLEAELNQREPRFNVAPTQRAPVVAWGDGQYETHAWRWGLVPSWAKDPKIGAKMINARAETVETKPAFRSAFKKRRCLIPASGYYEWTGKTGNKQPYFIHNPEGMLLMFAGLWEVWRASETDDWHRTFTIITGEPGKVSGDIHDRQPVIVRPECWSEWLTGDTSMARDVLQPDKTTLLTYYPVSRAVGNPRNEGPELVQAVEPG
ncbi:putative SOS response-associated peptidase YedK [Rhodanobacter sp. TND4EL1]